MIKEITYGENARLALDLSAERWVADFSASDRQPLDDPVAAVAAALVDPLDFPPLAACTVAGDRIVLAVDNGVPQVDAVVAGVVQTLLEAAVSPSDITIVTAPELSEASHARLVNLLPESIRGLIRVERHDPADRAQLTYLAVSKANQPVVFNRFIGDADVVIPIGTMRLENSLGYVGVHGGLFPTFSDEETRRRFRAPSSTDWAALQQRRQSESDEAAWLLGAQFTLQVIPGPGETILHVLAGDANRVRTEGKRLCEAVWLYDTPRRVSLVVATIEGGEEQQTWENFGRALFAASQVVRDDGAIVLCTQLQRQPGPSLQRLAVPESDDRIQRELRRDRSPDTISASLLLDTRQRHRVYLLSGLEGETVEDLGLGHVADAGQVERLGRQHESCLLLANAQHAMVRARDET